MRSVVVRALGALIASFLAVSGSLLAVVPAAQASIGKVHQQSVATSAADPHTLAISITGLTPSYATSASTVTLSGTLANRTGSALSGITVQASTSTQGFLDPSQMTEFTNGTSTIPLQSAASYPVTASVPNGATVRWSVTFQAAAFYGQFGVFPIQAQVGAPGTAAEYARTFLPFWTGGTAATQPKGLRTAWVWPLIDTPQQGACGQTLATSELASSVASGGRLATLLDAGSAYARTDQLTWAIDPALLSDVSVMTRTYFTHGNAACSGRSREDPSPAASKWLSQLQTSAADQPAFLTPYADVDVAALSHSGLEDSLKAAYRIGDTVAGQILPNTFGINSTGIGDGPVLKAALPVDGRADASVLTSLASDGGISTVVLSSDELSPDLAGGEDALAKTISGVGTSMSLLIANSRITSLLGAASPTPTQASQFALTQDFLAQTAMIAAEAPATSRSLVIAPPTGWDPSPTEANALLKVTHDAPWLHPAGLSSLAAAAAKLPSVTRVPTGQASGAQLSDAYLDHVATAGASLSLFKGILYQPPARRIDSLDAALAVTESSAWRGRDSPGGWLATSQLTAYLSDSESKVQIIASKKILLAGQSGKTPVSVQNGLREPIQVKVMAITPPGSQLQVGSFDALLKVQGGNTGTVRIPVQSATGIGTATVQLELATQDGSPLTWHGTSQLLSVEVTRFGRLVLIIIGCALGILVLTSAYRLRRKRLAGVRNGGSADETADAGGAG
ncbi:MAG: DUF6049 family protein [Trebonia sp.]